MAAHDTQDVMAAARRKYGWNEEQQNANLAGAYDALGESGITAQMLADFWGITAADLAGGETAVAERVLGPGFKQFAEDHGLTPLSDEFYVASDQVSFGATDKGLMVYTKEDNQVRLLPFEGGQ